jgi:hypothetical protein
MEVESVATGIGVLCIIAAVLAISAEAFTQRAWPRRTLVPGGIAMIVGILIMAAAA